MSITIHQLNPYYIRLTNPEDIYLLKELEQLIGMDLLDENNKPLSHYLHYNVDKGQYILFDSFAKGFDKNLIDVQIFIDTLYYA